MTFAGDAPGSDCVELPEVVLDVGSEGGSLTIVGVRAADGWHFRFVRDESTLCALLNAEDREGLKIRRQSDWVQSFESALALLDQYPWHELCPLQVHPDFKRQTWAAVQKRFRARGPAPEPRTLERALRLVTPAVIARRIGSVVQEERQRHG